MSKRAEYRRAAERATRAAGLRVVAARVGRRKGEFVARIMIGPHASADDARAFVATLAGLLQNQNGRTTDYDQWGFLSRGDCFLVAPIDYYERHREADGEAAPFFQLPEELGFRHEGGSSFRYVGQEEDGRILLLRLGLKEFFDG